MGCSLTYFDLLVLIRTFADVVVLVQWVINVDLRLGEERELSKCNERELQLDTDERDLLTV